MTSAAAAEEREALAELVASYQPDDFEGDVDVIRRMTILDRRRALLLLEQLPDARILRFPSRHERRA